MSYLLDTHTLLWFIAGDSMLPKRIKTLIQSTNTPCFVSIVSIWEIVIKKQIGKLEFGMELTELFNYIERNKIEILPMELVHFIELSNLPLVHSDPFDRIIISQAIAEKMIILGCDVKFHNYDVLIEWK
ncbi:MAG: type II toxin-antitoxin system VapC family toxin [Chitinophagaceae bacterium]|nr:type II toxin-antitoxin system VapC family toxin [Chitinophagaceae bacterium]